jgi:hypothetical protein
LSFPIAGATNVIGWVLWCGSRILGTGFTGTLEAFASIYGTPDAREWEGIGFYPLRFNFKSTESFSEGDGVVFDVVGDAAPYQATNVRRK